MISENDLGGRHRTCPHTDEDYTDIIEKYDNSFEKLLSCVDITETVILMWRLKLMVNIWHHI